MGVKINTRPFGEIEIDERQIITFPDGILGFDYIETFVLLDADNDKSPFKWLQASNEPELAFVVVRPVDFLEEYELKISQNDLEAVKAKSPDELLVLAIVTIPDDPKDMTANLQGPIIINKDEQLGKQAISLSDKYHVRHKVLDEMKKTSGAGG